MAHSRTAKKNIRKSERRRVANKAATSAMRTEIKKLLAGEGDLSTAQKLVDKAAKGNRMHKNKAARIKSRLAKTAAKS